jgi:hypothetical protein
VDGQEFADIEAYGVQRWLGELALALRQEIIDRLPSEECSYRKPTANSGRDVGCIMHLVQFGFGDGEARRGDLATQSRRL